MAIAITIINTTESNTRHVTISIFDIIFIISAM